MVLVIIFNKVHEVIGLKSAFNGWTVEGGVFESWDDNSNFLRKNTYVLFIKDEQAIGKKEMNGTGINLFPEHQISLLDWTFLPGFLQIVFLSLWSRLLLSNGSFGCMSFRGCVDIIITVKFRFVPTRPDRNTVVSGAGVVPRHTARCSWRRVFCKAITLSG